MAVTTKKQVYESHGQEFETKAEAAKYDEFCSAQEALKDAQHKFQRLLAETQRTADGQMFEFGVFHDYYAIVHFSGFPRLETVSFVGWNWTVDEGEFGVQIHDERNNRRYTHPIKKLYADRRNAEQALAEAQAIEIKSLVRESNAFRTRIAMPPLTNLVVQPE